MSVSGAQETITRAVTGWEGVTAQPHHILPESGWISFYLHQPEDVEQAIGLLAKSYAIARTQKNSRLSETIERENTDHP